MYSIIFPWGHINWDLSIRSKTCEFQFLIAVFIKYAFLWRAATFRFVDRCRKFGGVCYPYLESRGFTSVSWR